ncbi:UNKNOWN [Stylonychia lemnae]|uniref:Uncharacterized protein n=1 Tax=Stylonychia lemnae TaxID=5949 RepID=A0A078AS69_STYLE|nr:UNKNOWN [Stylonychia lemnae]|eukprot:CDW85014.1 UNKNOWN [Stylonychia lemnae]
MLTSGGVELTQRFLESIIQYAFSSAAHRSVRIQAYRLVSQMSSFFQIDWTQIIDSVIQDAQSTQDHEIMSHSYKIMQLMNFNGYGKVMFYFFNENNRELLIKILEMAFKSTDILIQTEALSQISNLMRTYYSNRSDYKNVNEENEGLGSTNQIITKEKQTQFFYQSLDLPVYVLRYAFQWQFEMNYFNQELCIYPPEIAESENKNINISPFQIRKLATDYLKQLSQIITSRQHPKFIKYSAFNALIALISMNNPRNINFCVFQSMDEIQHSLKQIITSTLDQFQHDQDILIKLGFIIPLLKLEHQVGVAINLMSLGHSIQSSIDRFYLLLICNWILIKVSLQLLQIKQNSTIFILFNQQWFVSLWTDIQDEDEENQSARIPYRYKEELCLSLIEASLINYDDILKSFQNDFDFELMDAWLLSSIEVAEICSKVMDWKIKQSLLGESISQAYLLFLEEVSVKIEIMIKRSIENFQSEFSTKAHEYKRRIQNQMAEIYKRMLDEVSIMGINNDQTNIQLPLIKASCILLLCKFWDPINTKEHQLKGKNGLKSEEMSFMIVSQLQKQPIIQSLIQQLLNQLCHNKDKALDMSQGVYLLLNSLFHLAFRFEDLYKKTVQELLTQIQVIPILQKFMIIVLI